MDSLVPDSDGKHFQAVATAMQEYSLRVGLELERRRRAIALLPSRHAELLPRALVQTKIRALEAAIIRNQVFLDGVLRLSGLPQSREGIPAVHLKQLRRWPAIPPPRRPLAPYRDHSKLESTFHSLAREWSSEGMRERQLTFHPLLNELVRLAPANSDQPWSRRVLVPGCGLGRLPWEIARLGYACQGNEFSYHMLLMSSYLLNGFDDHGPQGSRPGRVVAETQEHGDTRNGLYDAPPAFMPGPAPTPAATAPSVATIGRTPGAQAVPPVGPGGAFPGGLPMPRGPAQVTIHPWATRPSNHVHPMLQVRPVQVPDVDPVQGLQAMQLHAERAAAAEQQEGHSPTVPPASTRGQSPTDPRLERAGAGASRSIGKGKASKASKAGKGAAGSETESLPPSGAAPGRDGSDDRSPPLPSPASPFSMAAGEFKRVYSHDKHKGAWTAVVCCFFLDTAPNVMRYLEVIWECLEPGGLLISLGPLLYHWADRPAESLFDLSGGGDGGSAKPGADSEENESLKKHEDYGHGYDMHSQLDRDAAGELARTAAATHSDPRYIESIELTYAELRHVILKMGFEIVTERQVRSTYVGDNAGMMKTVYDNILFTARKPAASSPGTAGESRPKGKGAESRLAAASGAGEDVAAPTAVAGTAAPRPAGVLWAPEDATRSLQLGALPAPVPQQSLEESIGLQPGEVPNHAAAGARQTAAGGICPSGGSAVGPEAG